MILWPGDEMHEANEGCWGDRNGEECGNVISTLTGLCVDCYARLKAPVSPGPNWLASQRKKLETANTQTLKRK